MTVCVLCDCSEHLPCVDALTGETCAWVELAPGITQIAGGGVCSFCAAVYDGIAESYLDGLTLRARKAGA